MKPRILELYSGTQERKSNDNPLRVYSQREGGGGKGDEGEEKEGGREGETIHSELLVVLNDFDQLEIFT